MRIVYILLCEYTEYQYQTKSRSNDRRKAVKETIEGFIEHMLLVYQSNKKGHSFAVPLFLCFTTNLKPFSLYRTRRKTQTNKKPPKRVVFCTIHFLKENNRFSSTQPTRLTVILTRSLKQAMLLVV